MLKQSNWSLEIQLSQANLKLYCQTDGRISTIQNVNNIKLYRNNTTKTKSSNCNYTDCNASEKSCDLSQSFSMRRGISNKYAIMKLFAVTSYNNLLCDTCKCERRRNIETKRTQIDNGACYMNQILRAN